MATISQSELDLACGAVTDVDITGSGPVIYFYSIILDEKPCLKAGKTTKKLGDRIAQYLNKEHMNQNKMPSTLNVLGIIIMEDETIDTCETFIKSALKPHPLNKGQHSNIEQYDLCKGWVLIRDHIKYFPFALESFVNVNAESIISNLYRMCNANYRILANNFVKDKTTKKNKEKQMVTYLNKMTITDIKKIDGIGKVTSSQIHQKLPLSSMHGLNDISGISETRFNNIYKFVEAAC